MRKILLFIAVIFYSVSLCAQSEHAKDYSYEVSDPYKVFDAYKKFYFSKEKVILTVKVEGITILIQKFDNDLPKPSFVSQKLYEDFPKNMQFEEVHEFDNKLYVFYSSWDGGNVNKEQLFYREIDFATGEFLGESKLLFKVDGKISGSVSELNQSSFFILDTTLRDKFDFYFSHDKKKMLVKYRKQPQSKSDLTSYDVLGLSIYESDLKLKSSNHFKMPYTERRMDNLDYAIDNDGNAFLLAKVFHDDSNNDKKNRNDEEANYHLEILRIVAGSKDVKKIKIETNNKFVTTLKLHGIPNGDVVGAGFYSNGKNKNKEDAEGIVAFKIKKEGALYDVSTHAIPLELINQYQSSKDKNKNDKKVQEGESPAFKNLSLRDLVVDEDGSVVLIGEHFSTHSESGSNFVSSYYNDILVAKIKNNGELAWMKKIPKQQTSQSGMASLSFKHIYLKGNHYILFLDNLKNYKLALDRAPERYFNDKDGYFTAYKINDLDGKMTNNPVFNMKDVEEMKMHQFATSRIFVTGEDQFTIEVYKKKKEDIMIKVMVE